MSRRTALDVWHEHAVLRWELEVARAQAGVPAPPKTDGAGLNCVAPYGAHLWREHAVLRGELEVVRAQAGVPARHGEQAAAGRPRRAGLRH